MVLSPTVFGDWIWDDHQLIALNPHVSEFDLWFLITHHFWDVPFAPPTSMLYYRPVAAVGYALVYRIGGGDVLYFHLLNLLLHAACTALTATWLARRIDGANDALGRAAVAAATLAFALHPARVQSVAWASASTDLWATLFILVGLNIAAGSRSAASRVGAGVAFAFAILSKEVAVVAPVLVLLDVLLVEGRKPERLEVAGFAAPALLALGVRTAVVGFRTRPGASALAEIPLRATYSVGRYVMDTFYPVSPTVQINAPMDQLWNQEPFTVATMVLGALTAAALLALAIVFYRRQRLRPWLADLAWLVLPLLPVLNIIEIGQGVTIASRLLYLPLLGLTAASARLLVRLFNSRFRIASLLVTGAAIVGCALLSTQEIAHWQDDVTLARHLMKQRPDDPGVADNLARVLLRKGELVEAYYILSERLDAHGDAQSGQYAEVTWAYVRLALTSDYDQEQLTRLRDFFDEIASGQPPSLTLPERRLSPRLSELDRGEVVNNPTYGDFYGAWGWSHAHTGDLRSAIRIFDEAPSVTRDSANGCDRRVRARAFAADWDGALALLEGCEAQYPDAAWPPIRAALERGRALWATPDADRIEGAVARSRLMSDLGLPALGRAILAPFDDAADVRLVHARVQADISDERYDLALEELDAAIAQMPEARAELEAARQQVERFVPPANRRRSPPVWED